jgi:hypothetical protein
MPGTTTPKIFQAVIVESGSARLVSLTEAQEVHKKNRGAARWLKERIEVHRHEGGHSFIGEDGSCPHCRGGGSCKPVKLPTVDITPLVSRGVTKRPETKAARTWFREILSQLPPNRHREFETFTPDEIELFSSICTTFDASFDGAVEPGMLTTKLSTLQEQLWRINVEQHSFKPIIKRKPGEEPEVGGDVLLPDTPIPLRPTLSAERQRSSVESAFDYILGERKRKRLGVSAQEWWNRKLRDIFEKHRA